MAEITHLRNARRIDNTVLTVGTFDGVHIGHQVLIQKVVEKSRERAARSVIVTFDPHPRDIINPGEKGIRLLTSLEERMDILDSMGVDEMIVIPFDRDFSLMSSEAFIRQIIWEKIGVSEFIIGYDHHFGRDREGTIETVQRLAGELDFDVYVVSRQEVGNQKVSSTLIRELLESRGDVAGASRLLGHPYVLNGTVIRGEGRGAVTGFPTANIKPGHPNKSIPKNGVYAVEVLLQEQLHKGMMNIGIRPTFNGEKRSLEVHIFNFDTNIYGKEIRVRFMDRLRDEQRFTSVEALVEQLEKDRRESLRRLGDSPDS